MIFSFTFIAVLALLHLATYKRLTPPQTSVSKEPIKTSANIASVALLAHGNLAKRFHQPISIPWQENHLPESIIYGNKDFGYFKSDQFSLQNHQIKLEIIPPTFKKPVEFCIKHSGKPLQWIKSISFKNPRPTVLRNIRIQIDGEFNHAYFLLGAQFIPNESNNLDRAYLPIIVNKLGEIIWGHLPQNGKTSFKKYFTIKQINSNTGEYGILFGERSSYFEKFNSKGEIIESVSPRDAIDPYVIHHDFVYLGHSKLLTLGHKVHYLRSWLNINQLLKTPFLTLAPPTRFLATPLEVVDVKNNSKRTVWDPIEDWNPIAHQSWAKNEKIAQTILQSQGRHFSKWGETRAQVDWNHGNSIEYYPGIGILLSFRNLSKVIMLDEHTHDILWTLGNQADDTYQTLDDRHAFFHQHHVQLLPSGHIMMLDNHSSPPAPKPIGSRVLIYGLNQKTRKAEVIWNYQPQHHIRIGNRGSAYLLANNNIAAFYPASLENSDHLIEVDRKTGQPAAQMKIFFTDVKRNFSKKQLQEIKKRGFTPIKMIREGGGNRAVPIQTIGTEKRAEKNVICAR